MENTIRTDIDQKHYQIMENISNRLEKVASKSNKSDLWNKLKNGFEKLRNSSVIAVLGSVVAAGVVMAYGHDINHAGMVKDMTIPFASALGVGYAGVASFLLGQTMSNFSKNKAYENSRSKDKELDRVREELVYLREDFKNTRITNGMTQEKADTYNNLLSNYQNEADYKENKKRKGLRP